MALARWLQYVAEVGVLRSCFGSSLYLTYNHAGSSRLFVLLSDVLNITENVVAICRKDVPDPLHTAWLIGKKHVDGHAFMEIEKKDGLKKGICYLEF